MSALQFGGVPLQALEHAAKHKIACCAAIRKEVTRRLTEKFLWTNSQVEIAMAYYLGLSSDITTSGLLQGVCRDAADDVIIECALLAHANYIVTGDKDLLVVVMDKLKIVTPRQFLTLSSGL